MSTLLIFLSASIASGRGGGHVTTWDPNLFGGGWVCFQAQIPGCSQGFNAACDGITNDEPALAAWVAYGVSQGLSPAKLYVAPGAKCTTPNGYSFIQTVDNLNSAIKNAVIWAYGASISSTKIMGGFAAFEDGLHNALIQTVSAGSCTVTLANIGDAGIFSVDDWVTVGDIALANFGSPMTIYTSEANLITGKSGAVITISPCLKNSYKSTYPTVGGSFFGGPATMWKMPGSWNINVQYFGLTVLDGQSVIVGRDISTQDVVWNFPPGRQNTPAPSGPGNVWIKGGFSPSMEVDKNSSSLNIVGHSMRNIFVQSAGNTISIQNSFVSGGMSGTSTFETIQNSTINSAFIGPTNSPGGNLTLDGSKINTLVCSATMVDTSILTFGNGTFSIANNAAGINSVWATFVPGNKYYFGETDGTNDSVPHTQFSVTNLRQDATNTYIDTDLGNTLPTPTCNGHACFRYVAYQVMALSQKFSSAPGIGACVSP